MGYEIVSVDLPARLIVAMCPAGKRVIGGGCLGGNDKILDSVPLDDPNTPEYDANGWGCLFDGVYGGNDHRAVAICANMK